jgi:hypothetical protein
MIRLETTNRTATIFFRIVAILFDFKTSLCSDIDSSYLTWTRKFRYSSTALPATTKSQLQQSAKQQLPTAPHVHQIETPHRPLVPFVDAKAVAVGVSSPAFAVAVAVPVDCVEAVAVVTSPFAAV